MSFSIRSTHLTAREIILVGMIFLSLACIFFHFEISSGRVLVAGESVSAFFPWREHATGTERIQNFDQILQYYPWKMFGADSLSHGKLPLWNPYSFCGSPFMGNIQTQLFYPLELGFLLACFHRSFLIAALLKLMIAGLGTYGLCRYYSLGIVPSLLSGVVFSYSGFIILWLGYPHATIAAWTPAVLLITEKLLQNPSWNSCLALASVMGLPLFCGHPEMAFYLMLFTVVFFGVRLLFPHRNGPARSDRRLDQPVIKTAMVFIGAMVMAGLLAMMIWLPFLEYLVRSVSIGSRAEKSIAYHHLPATCWSHFVLPNAFGAPQRTGFKLPSVDPAFANLTYGEVNAGYSGLWTLFLAGMSIAGIRSHKQVRIFGWIALSILLMIFGCPGVPFLISHIPLLNLGFHLRTVFLLNLSVAVLAGAGLDHILQRRLRPKMVMVALTVFVVGIALIPGMVQSSFGDSFQTLGLIQEWNDDLSVLMIVLGAGILIVLGLILTRFRIFGWMVLGLIGVELFRFGMGYNPSVPESVLRPSHPITRELQTEPDLVRMTAMGPVFFPNMEMIYGIYGCRGYDALAPASYYAFLEAFDPSLRDLRLSNNPMYVLTSRFTPQQLKMLNVKYFLTPPGAPFQAFASPETDPGDFFRPSWAAGFATPVYQYGEPLERFHLVHQVQEIGDPVTALKTITSPAFQPDQEVILERSPDLSMEIPRDPASETVQVIRYEHHRIDLQTVLTANGILVASELDWPGWQAIRNGERVPILRANTCFRAVVIPVGSHSLSFVYDPISVRLGIFLTGIALLITGAICVMVTRQKWY